MATVNRTKVDFDPLSGLGGAAEVPAQSSSSATASTTAAATATASSSSATDFGGSKDLFADRTFATKASKSKSAPTSTATVATNSIRTSAPSTSSSVTAASSSVPSSSSNTAARGVSGAAPTTGSSQRRATKADPFMQGFSLTDDSHSRAAVEPLYSNNSTRFASTGPGMFDGAAAPGSAEADALESLLGSTKKPSVAGPGTGTFRLNVDSVGDDTKVDDLQVNSMLEMEEKLDYELFGKSNAAIGGADKRQTAAVASLAPSAAQALDPSVLTSSVFDLQISDTAPSYTYPNSGVEFSAPPPPSDSEVMQSLSSGDFDINAYIQSQVEESSGGGLFD